MSSAKENVTTASDFVEDKSHEEPASIRFKRYRAQRIDPEASSGDEESRQPNIKLVKSSKALVCISNTVVYVHL